MPDCAVTSVNRIAAGWAPVVGVEKADNSHRDTETQRRRDKGTRRVGDKENFLSLSLAPCPLASLSSRLCGSVALWQSMYLMSRVCLAALFCLEAVKDFELTFTIRLPPGGEVSPAQLIMSIARVRFEFHGCFKAFHRFPDVTL